MKVFERILDLLFPPKCPFCRSILDRVGICDACQRSIPWTQDDEAVRHLSGGVRCAAPFWYEDAVRDSLLRFKFRGGEAMAEPLGKEMAHCAAEYFGGGFDTVTWVPVGRKRLKKRGYDQAELLARAICRQWDTKPVRLLCKPVDNPPQSGIHDRAARRANVLGVYEPAGDPSGRRILLVDDICTTGETLNECARVLTNAGAAAVCCVTMAFARGESPDNERK